MDKKGLGEWSKKLSHKDQLLLTLLTHPDDAELPVPERVAKVNERLKLLVFHTKFDEKLLDRKMSADEVAELRSELHDKLQGIAKLQKAAHDSIFDMPLVRRALPKQEKKKELKKDPMYR
jgi:hypothetical protein